MKKIWKMFLATAVMSIAVCLCTGMSVFAEKVTGEIAEGFTWEVDTDSQTLTITGEGPLPNFNQDYHDDKLWKSYESSLHHLILEGVTDTEAFSGTLGTLFDTAEGTFSGFAWEANSASATVTVTGSGEVPAAPWIDAVDFPGDGKINYIFNDGITGISGIGYPTGRIEAGKDFQSLDPLKQASGPVTISEDNPYYASYEGCVYSKDMSKLFYCPYGIEAPTLYSGVKTIAAGAFDGVVLVENGLSRVVIPWGVTTIQDGAFSGIAGSSKATHYVVLPNTITSMTENALPGRVSGTGCMFIYQKDNQLVDNVLKGKTDSHQTPMANPVDSVAQYYPGQVTQPESSAPESSQPEPSKPAEPSEPAESTRPAEPSSKPADTSKPAQTASKPASQPQAESSAEQEKPSSATSESSAAAESSLSAESSLPEESILESSISESSPESSDELYEEMSREETPERTSGGVNWIIPLVFALGAMAAVAAVVLFIIWKKK